MNNLQQYSQINTQPKLTPYSTNCIGTGGTNTTETLKVLITRRQLPIDIELSVKEQDFNLLSSKELLEKIKKYLRVSVVDLSFIFKVTRPTIYSWLDGIEPRPESIEHIQKISSLSEELADYKIANIGKLLRRPIYEGKSMSEYLRSTEHLDDVWPLFKTSLKEMIHRRDRSKSSGKTRESTEKSVSGISTPLFNG